MRGREGNTIILGMFALVLTLLLLTVAGAFARDLDGRYGNSPLKGWFEGLHNRWHNGCCKDADGEPIDATIDADGNYHVVIDGEPRRIPDYALVEGVNKAGYTIIWLNRLQSPAWIRCFMPGPGA